MSRPRLSHLKTADLLLIFGILSIVAGQWLGNRVVKRTPQPSHDSQLQLLVAHAAILTEENNWSQLERFFQKLIDSSPEFQSIGYRDAKGQMVAATRGHRRLWQSESVQSIAVPIVKGQAAAIECCLQLDPSNARSSALFWVLVPLGCFSVMTAFSMYRCGKSGDTGLVPDRVRQALDTLAEGLLVLDEQERIVLANRAFSETCGIQQADLIGRTASSLAWCKTEATARGDFPWVRALIDNRQQIDQQLQYETSRVGQRVFSVNSAPIVNANGRKHGALATFRDITEMEEHRSQLENMLVMLQSSRDEISRKNRELEILATQDALTGCLNRRAFFDRFSRFWEHAVTNNQPLSCIMVDNDHFKSVNDTYGHHVGDDVLRVVAATLRKMQTPPNLVCRYGGEEFCLLLPGKTQQEANAVAEQIRQAITEIRFQDPEELRLTVSVGVSTVGQGAAEPQDLINQADKCLYIAKRSGRNRVVSYEPKMADMEIDDAKVSREKTTAESDPTIPYPAVSALLSALGYRDAETAEHSRRVADLVVHVVEGVLTHHDTYLLEIAALLHDVGKVGVPDHILLKSGPLTNEEWEIMRRHQRVGVELVASTFGNQKLETIIRNYRTPFAKEPPVIAEIEPSLRLAWRVLGIADSFDSMVNDHAYREALTYEQAFAELRKCGNDQFDRKLVEHFIARVQKLPRSPKMNPPQVISPQTAIQLGVQIERLTDALDHQDLVGLAALAARLRDTASHANLTEIAAAASKLEAQAVSQDQNVMNLVSLTSELLSLCRSTQTQVPV